MRSPVMPDSTSEHCAAWKEVVVLYKTLSVPQTDDDPLALSPPQDRASLETLTTNTEVMIRKIWIIFLKMK